MINSGSPVRRYGIALLITAAITLLIASTEPALEITTIVLLYLIGVLVVATATGLGPGIVTSFGSVLAFNFFFIPPRYTLHVTHTQDVLHLLSFGVVAIVASSLAARAQHAAERERRRATELAALYELSQTISARVDLGGILPIIAEKTCHLLQVPACSILLYNEAGALVEHARFGQPGPGLHTTNVPIREGPAVLGILRVAGPAPNNTAEHDAQQLLTTLAAQARLAIDRARLVAQSAHTQALVESDTLKSALIASVSHDLRTPLAIMKGATSTLLADDIVWDAQTQRALTQSIDAELDHLNRIVGNLLDMSRIESGSLSPDRDWQDLTEVLGTVLQRLAPAFETRPVHVDADPDLPLIQINATLIDQVLTNLLENALKYTPAGGAIAIRVLEDGAARGAPGITVEVRDHGPGIPAGDLTRIFEKFDRGAEHAPGVKGSGLGLAICKGIIEAHGGRIWARNCGDGGAAFMFTLPLGGPAGESRIGMARGHGLAAPVQQS